MFFYTGLVFVGKPFLVFMVSCVFLLGYFITFLLGRKTIYVWSWPLLVIAILWMLAAAWEVCCAELEFDRLHMFAIYPALIATSFLGFGLSIFSMLIGLFKKKNKPELSGEGGQIKDSRKKLIWATNAILVLGFLLNSALQLSIIDEPHRFDGVGRGLLALMSIPYLILFLANRYINRTNTACIIVMMAAFILVSGGLFVWITVEASKDALSGLMLLFFPMHTIPISIIVSVVAICFNKKKKKPKPSGNFLF